MARRRAFFSTFDLIRSEAVPRDAFRGGFPGEDGSGTPEGGTDKLVEGLGPRLKLHREGESINKFRRLRSSRSDREQTFTLFRLPRLRFRPPSELAIPLLE